MPLKCRSVNRSSRYDIIYVCMMYPASGIGERRMKGMIAMEATCLRYVIDMIPRDTQEPGVRSLEEKRREGQGTEQGGRLDRYAGTLLPPSEVKMNTINSQKMVNAVCTPYDTYQMLSILTSSHVT